MSIIFFVMSSRAWRYLAIGLPVRDRCGGRLNGRRFPHYMMENAQSIANRCLTLIFLLRNFPLTPALSPAFAEAPARRTRLWQAGLRAGRHQGGEGVIRVIISFSQRWNP
jgi:hypothetical protein